MRPDRGEAARQSVSPRILTRYRRLSNILLVMLGVLV